jgi:MoxR-like ATPase
MSENNVKYIESSLEDKVGIIQRVDEINFDEYSPENIDDMGEYIDLHGERERVERVLERADKPYLIYGVKGTGKTNLIHSICRDKKYALIEFNCGIGTNKSDLQGRLQVDQDGSYFQRGVLPIAYEVANHFGHAVFYGDELGALEEDVQKWINRPLDKRNSCTAGGKTYKLNPNCKLAFIFTTNPIEYAGVNNLTEDLKSRLIGSVWDYPSSEEVERIVDWTNIPEDFVKSPLLVMAQDTYSLRVKGDLEYVLSPRDLIQFTEVYRNISEDYPDFDQSQILEVAIKEAILIKYTDPIERELVKARAQETFGVTLT